MLIFYFKPDLFDSQIVKADHVISCIIRIDAIILQVTDNTFICNYIQKGFDLHGIAGTRPIMQKPQIRSFVLSVIFILIICTWASGAQEQIPVCVSIQPQQFFVQQIGGDRVAVDVLVPPGAGPATYEPKPSQMTALAKTRVYFSIGVPFESIWLDKIVALNPDMRVVHTDEDVRKHHLAKHVHKTAPTGTTEGPGAEGEGIPDPHIWLSPPLVMLQARSILLGLEAVDPAYSKIYARNYRAFILRLVDLDERLSEMFAGVRTNRFMVFHPAWGYFARAYGLEQIPVEIEGKSPKPAQLKSIIDYARQNDLTTILLQPQSVARFAEQVARAVDGQVIYADPLSPDWENNLLETAAKIKSALK